MRIAWLYPSTGLLDSVAHDIARLRGAEVFAFRVRAAPDAPLAVASLGEIGRLREVAAQARDVRPDVVVWACTAGSFIAGADREDEQCAALAEAAGCPATTTSRAIAWSIHQYQASRLLVISPYTEVVGAALCDYLKVKQLDVVAQAHAGHATDEAISAMTTDDILSLIPAPERYSQADCVLMPCTALRSEPASPAVTSRTGLPAVTANLATVDHALYMAYAGREGVRQ
jgi:maleate cis-trans isomerase